MPQVQSSAPSLVEVLKKIAHAWRSLYDQAAAMPAPDAEDSEDSPKALLMDQYVRHPIYYLFRLIEEHTGTISRGVMEQVAQRINTPRGLEPYKRIRRPTNPELAGFFDDTKPDLPDLLPVLAKLNECDVNGTTATILRRFEEKHPGVLAAFGFDGQTAGRDSTQTGKQKDANGASEKSKGSGRWITVSDAERISHIDKGVISRAADNGSLKSNGKKGRDRRIDALDLNRWKLERSKRPEPAESEQSVESLMKKHVSDYREPGGVQALRRKYDRDHRDPPKR